MKLPTLEEALNNVKDWSSQTPDPQWLADYCGVSVSKAIAAIEERRMASESFQLTSENDLPPVKTEMPVKSEGLSVHRIANSSIFGGGSLLIAYGIDLIIAGSGLVSMVNQVGEIIGMIAFAILLVTFKIRAALKGFMKLWLIGAILTLFLGTSFFLSLVTHAEGEPSFEITVTKNALQDAKDRYQQLVATQSQAEKDNRLTDARDLEGRIQEQAKSVFNAQEKVFETLARPITRSASIVFDRLVYTAQHPSWGIILAAIFGLLMTAFIEGTIYVIAKKG